MERIGSTTERENMSTEEEYKKQTLDHHVDEKFSEIYFLAKEEYDIEDNSLHEQLLYDMLDKFKLKLKKKCKEHFATDI